MTGSLAFAALAVVLPVAALIARRLPARRWILLGLAWVAIFGIGFLIAGWWYA